MDPNLQYSWSFEDSQSRERQVRRQEAALALLFEWFWGLARLQLLPSKEHLYLVDVSHRLKQGSRDHGPSQCLSLLVSHWMAYAARDLRGCTELPVPRIIHKEHRALLPGCSSKSCSRATLHSNSTTSMEYYSWESWVAYRQLFLGIAVGQSSHSVDVSGVLWLS